MLTFCMGFQDRFKEYVPLNLFMGWNYLNLKRITQLFKPQKIWLTFTPLSYQQVEKVKKHIRESPKRFRDSTRKSPL